MTGKTRMSAMFMGTMLSFGLFLQAGTVSFAKDAAGLSDMRGGVACVLDPGRMETDMTPSISAKSDPKQLYSRLYDTMVTVTDTLNVRTGPGTDSDVMGHIEEGTVTKVLSQSDDGWIGIEFGGGTGYIMTDYVEICSEQPVAESDTAQLVMVREPADGVGEDTKKLLAALIHCEAGGEPYEGQVAVGAVVMNRVNSNDFPDTISEVIYQPGQFTPVTSGKVDRVYNSGNIYESCIEAAEEALSGVSNVGDRLYFHRYDGCDGLIIGNHVFK